jgi:UDP-N-acetylmuramyl pentapeptide phosphotransferase/UDP-N-acetylglucosamine-1-phosphate transferase
MLILLGSIMISITLSWISIKVAPKIGVMDILGSAKHKKHRKPIPLTGGIVVTDTLFIMLFIIGYLKQSIVSVICFTSLLIALTGLVDDFINLKPKIKFSIQLLASILLITQGIQVNIFNYPEFFLRTGTFIDNYFNYFLTILWVNTLTISFNFIDSCGWPG